MATYRIGQRVKYVSGILSPKLPVGAVGTVQGETGFGYTVAFDLFGNDWELFESSIVPLTDPGADAFLARIKKICREPINEVQKVTVGK